MIKILLSGLLFVIFFNGCSNKLLMPYEEETLCNAGRGTGYCGSVSDVKEYRDNMDKVIRENR